MNNKELLKSFIQELISIKYDIENFKRTHPRKDLFYNPEYERLEDEYNDILANIYDLDPEFDYHSIEW